MPHLTQIDCYGFAATSQFYQRRELEPYMIRVLGDTTYVRFLASDIGPIHRLQKMPDETLVITWAYGNWLDMETLDYVPINDTLNVTLPE